LAIYPNLIGSLDSLTDVRRLTVYRNPTRNNEFFHVAPRANTGIGQYFVQLGHQGVAVQVFAESLRDMRRFFEIGLRLICIGLGGRTRFAARLAAPLDGRARFSTRRLG